MTSVGGASWGGQLLAHAQARLAADQAAHCASCTLKEDQKAVDAAQGIATAETKSASAQDPGQPSPQGDPGAPGQLVDITA